MKIISTAIPVLLSGLALTACDRFSKPSEGAAAPTSVVEVSPVSGDTPLSFNTHIQPILSEYCYHCHGPDAGTREPADNPLRLDIEEHAFEIRANDLPVIVRGDPGSSLLMELIKSKDSRTIMPPPAAHKELGPDQIALLERWIAEGAPYEEHWAFVAPVRATEPAGGGNWARRPIDSFIHAKLAEIGLKPSPPEDPRTLARRAALDLTGLLPNPADVERFAANPTEAAYEAFLDKLFDSPAYAEHRARYWLDYSRYADTHGLHLDNARSIWPYRDYVIRSFAAHKPYDQFVREQLAGDLLPAKSAEEWIATGYIRCNVSTNEGGTIPEEIHADKTRDRAEAFGAAFLGLTVGCAACHDHKFDPISQRDFFSLAAFFNNTAERSWDNNIAEPPPVLRLPEGDKRRELDAEIARRSAAAVAYDALRAAAGERFSQWLAEGNAPQSVSTEALELRLRLDEGRGETVKNSAPGAKTASYTAHTNPLIWDESLWLWPAMRLDIAGELQLEDQGDFESDEVFTASSWVRPREKVGGGANESRGTGNGTLFGRMGGLADDQRRGWDLFVDGDKLVVHIVHRWPEHAIRAETQRVRRGEWSHVAFSYDGSGRGDGLKLFINGEERPVTVTQDTLEPGQSIRTRLPLNLGRRHEDSLLRESAFQDLRIYRRALDPAEVARLPFEDHAAELVAARPDPATWTPTEKHFALDRFFLGKDPDAKRLRDELAAADQRIAKLGEGAPATLIAVERPEPGHAWVLDRGVYSARKELVYPDTPSFLPELPEGPGASRLALAEWLFSPENPLFSRVTVNRAWQELFGAGLVVTADDFGIMGDRPSHPELLDWLAVEFRESGWDLRHLYKLLLTSSTYRQASAFTPANLAADPDNIFLSRGPRFRMDAEMLRDTALQASGLLAPRIGGPPVKPYQPEGIWEAVSMPGSNTFRYKQDSGEALYRRSLYTFWKRFAPPPSLETFDAQAREVVCIRRARTNTPLQALVSMNDPQFVEAARKLAERAILHAADAEERLKFIASTLLARPLAAAELSGLMNNLATYATHFEASPQDAADLLTTGEIPANPDLNPVEVATWTLVANQFLNLDETLTK